MPLASCAPSKPIRTTRTGPNRNRRWRPCAKSYRAEEGSGLFGQDELVRRGEAQAVDVFAVQDGQFATATEQSGALDDLFVHPLRHRGCPGVALLLVRLSGH